MGPSSLRVISFGLLAGGLLSLMRAPQGLDWTQLAAVDGTLAAVFRAAGLIAVALFLDPARRAFARGVRPLLLLAAAGAGFALHAGGLALVLQPDGRLGYGLAFLGATGLLWLCAGRRVAHGHAAADAPDAADAAGSGGRPGLVERAGWLLGGAGAALAVESLAHELRQFGLAMPADDGVFATVFLLALLLGAVAFGQPLAAGGAPGRRRVTGALALALVPASTLVGLRFLGGLDRDALWGYFKAFPEGWGLGVTNVGTWASDGLLAGASLIVVGFAGGTALFALRHPTRLASVLYGAALGLLVRPQLVDALFRPMSLAELGTTPWSWQLIATGGALAASGAVLATWGTGGRGRLAGLAGATLAGGVLAVLPPVTAGAFSPWFRAEIAPSWVRPTAEGMLTIESLPDGSRFVTLDRRRLTPTEPELEVDEQRLRFAWSLVDPVRRELGTARVLLVGQLTPERDFLLRGLGVQRMDRTAPWFGSMGAIEHELFAGDRPPLGNAVAPADARARLRAGDYDLVLALPGHGCVLYNKSQASIPWSPAPAPVLGDLVLPEGTVGVAWLDAASPLAVRGTGGRVMLALDAFQGLSVGLVVGAPQEARPEEQPILLDLGRFEWNRACWISPLAVLDRPPVLRSFDLRERLLDRMARATEGGARAELARGLKLHYAAQEISSPYETLAQSIELNEEELRAFFAAVEAEGRMDPFSRALWEGISWLLVEKRMPDLMVTYVEALADAFGPWPALDRGLGVAYDELLQPETALRFLERALAAEPYSVETYEDCAELALRIGDARRAAGYLRGALEQQPERYDLRRGLGLALLEAEDPEGESLLRALLEERPDDRLIRARLLGEPFEEDEHAGHDHD